jgi:hypothetical protein
LIVVTKEEGSAADFVADVADGLFAIAWLVEEEGRIDSGSSIFYRKL